VLGIASLDYALLGPMARTLRTRHLCPRVHRAGAARPEAAFRTNINTIVETPPSTTKPLGRRARHASYLSKASPSRPASPG
jgi:hypothetical protein